MLGIRREAVFLILSCTISLALSTLHVSDDCPTGPSVKNGFIKEGTQATCECASPNVYSSPFWENSKGEVVSLSSGTGSSVLMVSYNTSERNMNYTCKEQNAKGGETIGGTFMPSFAYGPKAVSIESPKSGAMVDLCPGSRLAIICTVPRSAVNPSPKFEIWTNPSTVPASMYNSDLASAWRFEYYTEPEDGGNYEITCSACNSVFDDLYMDDTIDVTVRMPPKTAPVIQFNGGEDLSDGMTVEVAEGDNILVTCRVNGGTPLVSEITLQCGSKARRDSGNVLTYSVVFMRNESNPTCTCSAGHESGCYDLETTVSVAFTSESVTSSETGLYVGIGLGCAAIIASVVVIAVCFIRRRRRQSKMPAEECQYDSLNEKQNYAHTYQGLQRTLSDGYSVPAEQAPPPPLPRTAHKNGKLDPPLSPDGYITPKDPPPEYIKARGAPSEYLEPVDPPAEYLEPSAAPKYPKPSDTSAGYLELSDTPAECPGRSDLSTSAYSEPEDGSPNHVTLSRHLSEDYYEELGDYNPEGYILPKDPPLHYVHAEDTVA